MIKIIEAVKELLLQDDVALTSARRGVLNLSAYARQLQPTLYRQLLKEVQLGSIVTALSRIVADLEPYNTEPTDIIQSLSVHSHLEGLTYERSAEVSSKIRELYHQTNIDDHTFLTVTQGINEVTIVAEERIARAFRKKLQRANKIYDKTQLVGITVKLKVGNLEVPNLIFAVSQRLAYKRINIIEVVSTATELTYIIERQDLAVALEQLQKDI